MLGLLTLLLALTGGGSRAEEAPQGSTPEAREALEDLSSPFERTRRAAVRRLVAGLPGSRTAVLEALPGAGPDRLVHLMEVLAADGSPAAVRALLEVMEGADAALAVRIRKTLAGSEEATRRVLEAWERDPALEQGRDGKVSERARLLEGLLRRAEAERLFVSRKSRSGSTGSYRGQYDVLLPYRKEAVAICVGLLMDRAVPVPGIYTAGTFEFLRPLPVHVEPSELQGMAAHAFSELARKEDLVALATLAGHLYDLWDRIESEPYLSEIVFRDLLGQYADLLVALYLVRPEQFRTRLDAFLDMLRENRYWRSSLGTSYTAIVMLRVGRYEEAVRELEVLLYSGVAQSEAGAHYNLACAYAQWGEQTEHPTERRRRLQQALDHLEQAVDNQWLDIGWMEEDRDLEPIRDTDTYRELAARVRDELGLGDD